MICTLNSLESSNMHPHVEFHSGQGDAAGDPGSTSTSVAPFSFPKKRKKIKEPFLHSCDLSTKKRSCS